ncbi:MAG: hypothetical protein K8W52_30845, partial [Deltaproteobacteria bacterium]|nr:hypothetical protein [Deltaproteobacteria bacterium]
MERRERDQVTAADRGVVAYGRTFAYLIDHDGLCASILWDAPDEDDARALVEMWRLEQAMPPHGSLFDAGLVTAVTPAAFAVI